MKQWKLLAVLDALFCLGVVAMPCFIAAGQEFTGSINGIVIDARGKPVAGAWVSVFCGNRPLGGRIPGALSDERGRFVVDSLELDQCNVSACKEVDDVPCPPFFYVAHSIQVTLTAKVPFLTVKVQLGEKGTVITGMVRDASSGKPLAASFMLRLVKDPNQGMSSSSPPAFRIFVAPSTDYSLEFSAPGYKDWSYANHHSPSGPLRLAPRAHLHLDVQLEPLN
jgi:hypothetical protein